MSLNFLKITKFSIVLAIISLLSACVSQVRTTVSAYQGGTSLPTDATFFITAQDTTSAKFDELEFKYFAGRLAANFEERGFQVVPEDQASHKVVLQYDSERQKKDTDESRIQLHTGFGYRYRYGSVVLVDRNDYDQYEFARRIRISIEENNSEPEKIVSLSAVSYGRCEHLNAVFDEMVTAVLNNLYSQSGSVNPVKVPTRKPCSGSR